LKLSGDSGEPVDRIVRSFGKLHSTTGRTLSFSHAARKRGLVPKISTRSRSAMRQSTRGSGCSGEPSYNTTVAPIASPLISQFHIIQPHVVK
jgi:hypothetical protein